MGTWVALILASRNYPAQKRMVRLRRGPAGERLRSALCAVAPSWLAQMPSLQKRAEAERLRRWHSDATPHRMLREFAGLIEAISSDHPMVLVLEDLHWSDHGHGGSGFRRGAAAGPRAVHAAGHLF